MLARCLSRILGSALDNRRRTVGLAAPRYAGRVSAVQLGIPERRSHRRLPQAGEAESQQALPGGDELADRQRDPLDLARDGGWYALRAFPTRGIPWIKRLYASGGSATFPPSSFAASDPCLAA